MNCIVSYTAMPALTEPQNRDFRRPGVWRESQERASPNCAVQRTWGILAIPAKAH
jgi:hypothetical protein